MSDCNKNQMTGKLESPRRNNYFYGKMLDEKSLTMEQRYFNQKRWLLNRLGLGRGVLCGLNVTVQDQRICISAGVAIDGLGREIVVPSAILIDPRQITDDAGRPTTKVEGDGSVYLTLCYCECSTDYVPVLVTDCDSTNQTAPSTIIEGYCLIVKPCTEREPAVLPPVTDPELCEALNDSEADAEKKREMICEVLSKRPCPVPGDCIVLAKVVLSGATVTVEKCAVRPLVYSNPELFEMLMCLTGQGGAGMPGQKGDPGPGIDRVVREDRLCTEEPTVSIEGESPNRTLHLGIPPGCRGEQGPPGLGIDRVVREDRLCTEEPTVRIEGESPNRTLYLGIPPGCQGPPGIGLDDTLTKISMINWNHDGYKTWQSFQNDGLRIDFSDEVRTKPSIDRGWFLVTLEFSGYKRSLPHGSNSKLLAFLLLFLRVAWPQGTTHVVRLDVGEIVVVNSGSSHYFQWYIPAPNVALLIRIFMLFVRDLRVLVRVNVKCDFLVDKIGRSVDGNHLRGTRKSGDGIQGGEFESWFELQELNSIEVPNFPPSGSYDEEEILNGLSRYFPEIVILKDIFI